MDDASGSLKQHSVHMHAKRCRGCAKVSSALHRQRGHWFCAPETIIKRPVFSLETSQPRGTDERTRVNTTITIALHHGERPSASGMLTCSMSAISSLTDAAEMD